MIDLSNAPTVTEFVKKNGYTKLWLCPSIVSDGRISTPDYLTGIDCSSTNIPVEIRDKKVRQHFIEADRCCIIWENDDDEPFYTITVGGPVGGH